MTTGSEVNALPEQVDEILTLEELATRLRLSVWTVRRLVKRRVISSLRTGRVLRFHWPTVKHRLGAGELSHTNPSSGPGMRGRFVHH